MDYTTKVQAEIMAGNRLFGWNYGLFYSVGDGLVAKVFKEDVDSESEARKEFDNLAKIRGIGDPRLNVPEPMSLINLGNDPTLKIALTDYVSDNPSRRQLNIYAVIMPLIEGKNVLHWDRELWERYRNPTRAMVEAMVEHGVYKDDLKPLEVIGKNGTEEVFFVDTHRIIFYTNPRSRKLIRSSCRILFEQDLWSDPRSGND